MESDRSVVALLNRQLTRELTAVNQYFLHARMYQHWGLGKLGDKEYHESIDEMKHADKLARRILMLDGLPNFQDLGKINIGEDAPEMLRSDLGLEKGSQVSLKEAIAQCEVSSDFVSRDILTEILDDTEEHIDWIETQLGLIDRVGLQNYLQSQMTTA